MDEWKLLSHKLTSLFPLTQTSTLWGYNVGIQVSAWSGTFALEIAVSGLLACPNSSTEWEIGIASFCTQCIQAWTLGQWTNKTVNLTFL